MRGCDHLVAQLTHSENDERSIQVDIRGSREHLAQST